MAPAPTLTLSIPEETPPSNLLIVLSGVVLICFLIYGALEYSGFFLRHAQLSDLPPFFELGRVYRVRGPTRNRLAPFSASMARHMAVMSALERGEERRVRDAFLKALEQGRIRNSAPWAGRCRDLIVTKKSEDEYATVAKLVDAMIQSIRM